MVLTGMVWVVDQTRKEGDTPTNTPPRKATTVTTTTAPTPTEAAKSTVAGWLEREPINGATADVDNSVTLVTV